MKSLRQRIRGALGNAALWGAAWFAAGLGYFTALLAGGGLPGPELWTEPWKLILYVALNSGVTGFVAGGGFSIYVSRAYRDHDVGDISPLRFGLGGAVTAGLLSSALAAVLRSSSGIAVTMDGLVAAGTWGVLVGGITAFGTIKLAQRATKRLDGRSDDLLGPGTPEMPRFLGGRLSKVPTQR